MNRTSGRMGSRQAIFLSRRLNRCTRPIDRGIGSSEEPLALGGLPDGVAVVLLDPGGDRGVGVVFELVLEAEGPAVELDVLVRLVVAGAPAGAIGHLLVAAQAVLEQPQVPARGIAAVADRTAEEVIVRVQVVAVGLVRC